MDTVEEIRAKLFENSISVDTAEKYPGDEEIRAKSFKDSISLETLENYPTDEV